MVHFPNEIWLGVANYLKLPTDVCKRKNEAVSEDESITQQTLISLCLVSKQFRTIFQPQLYRNFVKHQRPAAKDRLLKPDSEWQHRYYQQDERSFRITRKQTKLESFLVTIIHRPDLAAMVKHLRIGSFSDNNCLPICLKQLYERVPLHKAVSCAFVDALRSFKGFGRFGNRFRRFWEKHLWDGNEGAEVALLLTLLPNLHSLRYDSRSGSLNLFVDELFSTILGPSPKSWILKPARGKLHKHPVELQSSIPQPSQILPVLRVLDVWSFAGYTVPLDSVMHLLSQPFITSFNARGLFGNDPFLSFQPGITFASLRHLQLVRCVLNGRGLEGILKRCTKLQSLVVNIRSQEALWHTPLITSHFDALQHMTDTLECLTLILPEHDTAVHLDLKSFTKLRYIHVDMPTLTVNHEDPPYIHELLPTSIEKIIIRKTWGWIKPHIDRLVDEMTAYRKFPALRILKIHTIPGGNLSYLKEGLEYTKELARELDLRLEIEDDPIERDSWRWGHDDLESGPDLDSDQEDSDDQDEGGPDEDDQDEVEDDEIEQ
ncbi:hypothetical protein KCU99_g3676, partial [Aureobasidium melanogenum]